MPATIAILAQEAMPSGVVLVALASVLGLLGVACLFCWWWAIQHKQLTLQVRPGRSPIGFIDVIVTFVLWVGCQIVASGLMVVVHGISQSSPEARTLAETQVMMFYLSSSQLVATLLAAVYLLIRYRSSVAVGWDATQFWQDVKLGLLGFVMIIPAILLVQTLLALWVPYSHPTLEMMAKQSSLTTLLVCWFGAVLVAPLTEEFFFRGMLQNWLQRLSVRSIHRNEVAVGGFDLDHSTTLLDGSPVAGATLDPYSAPRSNANSTNSLSDDAPTEDDRGVAEVPVWPVFVTATVFGLLHWGQGAAPFVLVLLGIGLGLLYRRTRTLLPCVIVHLMLNGYSMFWFTLNALLSETP